MGTLNLHPRLHQRTEHERHTRKHRRTHEATKSGTITPKPQATTPGTIGGGGGHVSEPEKTSPRPKEPENPPDRHRIKSKGALMHDKKIKPRFTPAAKPPETAITPYHSYPPPHPHNPRHPQHTATETKDSRDPQAHRNRTQKGKCSQNCGK